MTDRTGRVNVPATDPGTVRAFLARIMRPGGVYELTCFDVLTGRAPNLTLFADDPDAAARFIRDTAPRYRVAYIRPNPLNRAATARPCPQKKADATDPAGDRDPHAAANTADVARLAFLQLDCDATTDDDRPAATDEQHAAALRARDRVRSWLFTMYGMEAAYVGDTGNGGNLLYAMDLANTPENRRMLKACVATINRELAGEGIRLDPVTVDAPRYVGIAGTRNAKERAPDESHHWRVRSGEIDPDAPAVTLEQLRDLAAPSLTTAGPTRHGPRRQITLDAHERNAIIAAFRPYWTLGHKHDIGQGLAGWLWHRCVGYEQARGITIALSEDDTRQDDRLASLDRAYQRGAAGETVEYFSTLTAVMGDAGMATLGTLTRQIDRARASRLTASGRPVDPGEEAPAGGDDDGPDAGSGEATAGTPGPDGGEGAGATDGPDAGPPYADEQFRVIANAHHIYVPPVEALTGGRDAHWRPLSNFAAWAIADVIYPENDELNYSEVVLTDRAGRRHGPKRIPAKLFRDHEKWLGTYFGSRPRVYHGVAKAKVLNAIQAAGGDVPQIVCFDRLGWQRTGDTWRYLAANGAMGAACLDSAIRVEPGGRLEHIVMHAGTDDLAAVRDAVRAILTLPERIARTAAGRRAVRALLAGAFRAALIPARRANFTLSLVGITGAGKSGVAGIVTNCYGPIWNYDYLPGNWQSTARSLEDLLPRAGHCLLVVDDYLEKAAGGGDMRRKATERDTLIRMQANGGNRARLRPDATRNDGHEPAGILVSTQETAGAFLDASEIVRQLFLDLDAGDLDLDALTTASRTLGKTGTLNRGFSAYIRHLAGIMPQIVAGIDDLHAGIMRDDLAGYVTTSGRPLHERTKPAAADLLLGWAYFLAFAVDCGAISAEESAAHETAAREDIAALMLAQDRYQSAEAPARVILNLIQEAIASRHACLAWRVTDQAPRYPESYGWTVEEHGESTTYRPAQHRIGWIDEHYVYLIPTATAEALRPLATVAGKTLPIGQKQLGAALAASGYLNPGSGGPSKSVRIGGASAVSTSRPVSVLVIPRELIFPDLADESEAA